MSTLIAHAEDLLARAECGEVCWTAFLTPAERVELRCALGMRKNMREEGGYKDAERCRIFFLPPYMLDVDVATQSEWLTDFLQRH
jgi:RNA-binding protein YlmH